MLQTTVSEPGDIDSDRLTSLLCRLISIHSVNPIYETNSAGEAEMSVFISNFCRDLGLEVELQEVVEGRQNVVARLDCPRSSHSLLFETHMDTVATDPMGARALAPEVRDGMVYGRGACDAKGSLAAMLATIEVLVTRREHLSANIVLLAAADEEFKFRGILRFIESGEHFDGAVVGEPTALRVVVAHGGSLRFRINTVGRAAHSSSPESGVNAISAMAKVIERLNGLTKKKPGDRPHPLVGLPSMNVGRIWGGTGVNTVPDRCTIEVDRRLIPGEDAERTLSEIDRALARLGVRVERDQPFLVTPTLDTPRDSEIVIAAQGACRKLGLAEDVIGVRYGSDASKLSAYAKVPSIVIGPGSIQTAHGPDECVSVAELVLAARLYEQIALQFGAG